MKEFWNRLLNSGINPTFDVETVRTYRQVNGLSLFFAFIAINGGAITYATHYSTIIVWIQVVSTVMYLIGYLLVRKNKLRLAQNMAVLTYEMEVFFLCLTSVIKFDNGIYYSDMLTFALIYPVLAALIELPIFLHMGISILQLGIFFIIGSRFSYLFEWSRMHFGVPNLLFFKVITPIYMVIMTATITFILYKENIRTRKEIKRDVEEKEELLKKVETDMEKRLEIIKEKEKAENNLRAKTEELEKINSFMVNRELKMAELKKELDALRATAGIK